MLKKVINSMREYASINNIPIITDDGLSYLMQYIKDNNIKRILEIGTAIGYSAIMMCSISDDISVTSIERDEVRYLEAVSNVSKAGMSERINLIYSDAFLVDLEEEYDLIFIDAAKAQSMKFFLKFEKNLSHKASIITDNMNFHGLVGIDTKDIPSRNLRQLVRKIKNYKEFLDNNKNYDTKYLDIGDGLAVSRKL